MAGVPTVPKSPLAGVRHRLPRLLGRQRGARLQEFDGLPVRRAHEGHHAVAWRPVDGDARFHQPLAGRIDVVHLEGEVAEIARFAVVLGVPIVSELEERRVAAGGEAARNTFVYRPFSSGRRRISTSPSWSQKNLSAASRSRTRSMV